MQSTSKEDFITLILGLGFAESGSCCMGRGRIYYNGVTYHHPKYPLISFRLYETYDPLDTMWHIAKEPEPIAGYFVEFDRIEKQTIKGFPNKEHLKPLLRKYDMMCILRNDKIEKLLQ